MALLLALTSALGPIAAPALAATKPAADRGVKTEPATATPIKHLVVIFQENVSFDHYFGTYPVATNPSGEPPFAAVANTPTVNGLTTALLMVNPNLNPRNGAAAANPFRLDRSQAVTSDQDHSYTAEQQAFDSGLMDLFPQWVRVADQS
jgi:phospholipase C